MEKQGSFFGALLLVGASCLGAGMLGLPIKTGLAGYIPSLFVFILIWALMTIVGLMLVEVNTWHKTPVDILTMAESTLGKTGKAIAAVFYLFLFYAVLVAFVSVSGNMLSSILKSHFNIFIPPYSGSLFFVFVFGFLVFLGTRYVDMCNRGLMFVKVGSFFGLIVLGVKYVQPAFLIHSDVSKISSALPLIVTAFCFQNLIPAMNKYLNNNTKKTRHAMIAGSFFALVIYIIWQTIALGIIPLNGDNSIEESLKIGREASETIGVIMRSSAVGLFAQLLGFFAILTSFLAQSLALSHFLSEGFKISYKKHENFFMCCLTLIPPLILALLYPGMFFKALDFAGGFCIVVLFGILPVLMIWNGRYRQNHHSHYKVFGGKPLLIGVFLLSAYIFYLEIQTMLNSIIGKLFS